MIPYNPIAGGMLSGKHRPGAPTEGTRFTLGNASQTYQDRYWHDREFETWANMVYSTNGDGAVSLKNFRRQLRIEVLNLQGTVVVAYNVYRVWVSEYQALPDLDANANAVALQTIKLENEGWERDDSVSEPSEPVL